MGKDYNINLKLHNNNKGSDFIKVLLEAGWRVFNNKEITFLPLRDNGEFNWVSKASNIEEIFNIIDEKERSNEVIGLVLYWRKTNIGVRVTFKSIDDINIALDINRKEIKGLNNMTNVNWYFERLIEPINCNFTLDSITYAEKL